MRDQGKLRCAAEDIVDFTKRYAASASPTYSDRAMDGEIAALASAISDYDLFNLDDGTI